MNTKIGSRSKINMTDVELTPCEDEVHVWLASLDRRQSELKFFENILAEDEIDRANRFHFQKDRERFVAGRGILRIILSSYVGVAPSEILFMYGNYGKPWLSRQDGRAGVQFNLAHSDGTAIYAVTRDRPVGVDIESLQADFPVEEVAKNYFSSAELSALQALPKTLRIEAFFKCWTRKEAFIKAIGDGLSCPLSDFDVSVTPGDAARLLHVRSDCDEASRWWMEDIDAVPGFSAAMVFSGSQCRMHVSQWPLNSGTNGTVLESINE